MNNDNPDRDASTPPPRGPGLTRRSLLGSAALIPVAAASCSGTGARRQGDREPARVLSSEARRTLEAFTDRLVPEDGNGPGALAAGAPVYIENSLADWNRAEVALIEAGLGALDAAARRRRGSAFAELDAADRDAMLAMMESGALEGVEDAAALFNRLHRLTLEGMFSDPYYGGNRDYIGWDLIGYPGAVMVSTPDMQRMGERLPPLHTSAYGGEYDGD